MQLNIQKKQVRNKSPREQNPQHLTKAGGEHALNYFKKEIKLWQLKIISIFNEIGLPRFKFENLKDN